MDLSYDAFKNGKTKPSKTSAALSYETFKAKKEKTTVTQAERADRISKGQAVSVNKNKAAPSFGGKILRGIAKPAATLLARPGQMLAAISGFTQDEQTVKSKYLGDIKTSSSGKDVLKDVGRGLELVSNAVGIGAVKGIATGIGKQSIKQIAKRTAIEGAASGYLQGVGSGISEGKTGKDLLWSAAKSTALGGVIGGAIGGIGAKVFGGKGAKTVEEIAVAKAPYKVPAAGVAPTPKLENPVELRMAENLSTGFSTKGSKNTQIPDASVLPPDKTITPKGTIVPRVTIGEPIKVPKAKAVKQSEILNNIPDEEFTLQVKETSKNFYNEDPQRAFRMIEGKESIPEGVNKRALYALAKIDATGEQAVRLAELRSISSKSGQDLSMLNQGESNGIVDKIVETNDYLKKTLNPKEAKKAIAELADEIRANRPTLQELDALINEITC